MDLGAGTGRHHKLPPKVGLGCALFVGRWRVEAHVQMNSERHRQFINPVHSPHKNRTPIREGGTVQNLLKHTKSRFFFGYRNLHSVHSEAVWGAPLNMKILVLIVLLRTIL